MERRGNTPQDRKWRNAVLARANKQCAICGGIATHAHHIKQWAIHPRLRYKVKNGMALCALHHARVHFTNPSKPSKPGNPWLTFPLEPIVEGVLYRVKSGYNARKIINNLPKLVAYWPNHF